MLESAIYSGSICFLQTYAPKKENTHDVTMLLAHQEHFSRAHTKFYISTKSWVGAVAQQQSLCLLKERSWV